MFQFLKKAILPVAALTVVFASSAALAAQIEGGNFYRVKNITTGSSYADQTTADKCQTVQFLTQIHNPGPESLTGVKVKATLPTTATDPISSAATISASNAASQTDTATVDLPQAYKIDYVAGSTKLLDHNAGVLQGLPDGILGAGVDIPGGVGVSLQQIRYVQFQAKIDCPQPPVCPPGTTGTPPNCVEPPKKNVACDALSAEVIGSTNIPAKIKFTAKATATGGAAISGYVFDFGDDAKQETTNATIEHTYNKEGNYTATVQAKSSLGTTAVAANCSVTIKVTKEKPPVVVPPVTTKPTPSTTVPGELPATGPEAAFAGLFGTGALGFSVRSWLASRRRLSASLDQ